MKLKLFQITDTKTRKPVPGLYFDKKPLAKQKRRELNGDETLNPLRYVVSPGPDHTHYQK